MNWKNEVLGIIHDVPRKRILPKEPKERRKTIRIYLAVMIAFIAPLGLALYWFISNLLMIVERVIINKIMEHKEEEENA